MSKRKPIRTSTGGVVTRQTTRGESYHVRYRAAGARRSELVGYACDGVTATDAQRALDFQLERVRRGEWAPPVPQSEQRPVPSFREAASDWFAGRKVEGGKHGEGLSPKSIHDLEWRLGHLLREFANTPLDQIDTAAVDNLRRGLVKRGLSAASVNKTLATLAAVIEEALDHEVIDGRNPAKGKRRRLPSGKPRRSYLDRAEHIGALLDAARELDAERPGPAYRRALLAVLVLAGLRIDSCLTLRVGDVHLASRRLHADDKSDAGNRMVDLLPLLHDELSAYIAALGDVDPGRYLFATSTGNRHGGTNIRRRVLAPAVKRANERLLERRREPLPAKLTPHSMRRTFASLLYALGHTPPYVMEQLGHESPNLALALYAKAMNRRDGEQERLQALVNGADWATTGNRVGRSDPRASAELPEAA